MSIPTLRGLAPPTDGSVSLPETVDFHRKYNPNVPIYVYSDDADASRITKITYLEFGRACDRVAHYVRPERLGPDREVIAIIALSDALLYQTVVIGIMRAGFIPYPMSPRNTPEATVKLLKDTSCHRLLATRETLKSLIDEVRGVLATSDPNFVLSVEEMPPLLDIYPLLGREGEGDLFKPYPSGPRPSLDDTALNFHSSGTTGFPKTISHTFRLHIHCASFPAVTELRDHQRPQIVATQTLPCFHAFGFISQLLTPLYGLAIIGLYPPIATATVLQPMLPSPQNILDHTKRTRCTTLLTTPSILKIWAQDSNAVNFLAGLDLVVIGGGPLPSRIGDNLIEAGVYLTSLYGGTEFGPTTHLTRTPGCEKEWEYLKFSNQVKPRWEDQGNGTYELHFLTCDTHRPSIENLPNVKGYATSDLWIQHPKQPILWKIVGRNDDVIIHSSGEKTVPGPIETAVMGSPFITGAVLFGHERDQPGVIIELDQEHIIDVMDEGEVLKARNLIWPTVEEANKLAPSFSRIYKELILFTSRAKPLPRSGKGTPMRKATLNIYAEEIDKIYAKVETAVKTGIVVSPLSWSHRDVEHWLLSQISDFQMKSEDPSVTGDFFEMGLDSLGATILRHRIIAGLHGLASEVMEKGRTKLQSISRLITPTTIYEYSSISKLAKLISSALPNPVDHCFPVARELDAIENMVHKYSNVMEKPDSTAVLLTGTTGNLGSQLLVELLGGDKVERVYALNRPSRGNWDIKKRHEERFINNGFDVSLLSDDRIVFLEGDTSQAALGLKVEIYQELLDRVNIIIHNAWKLNFNLPLPTFESNIQGTRRLVDFARSSRHASSLKFIFASSVGIASSWDKSMGDYPEEVILDAKYAVGSGYAESKYVAERILSQSGLQSTSFRIGQISGGLPNGAWATTDWVPILVKSSLAIRAFPSAVGVVSWLPTPAVAQTLLDIAFSPGKLIERALNVVHPRPVTWDFVISGLNDALVQEGVLEKTLPVVEFSRWFELVRERADKDISSKDINALPAIKLSDFFLKMAQADQAARQLGTENWEAGGLPRFSLVKVHAMSDTMKKMSSLDGEAMLMWVKHWKRAGLFHQI